MIKKLYIIPLFCLLIWNPAFGDEPDEIIQGMSIATPNPYNNVSAIAEDGYGNLWFGTDGDGLFQFDGENYLKYSSTPHPKSIHTNVINDIVCDTDNQLWLGTQNSVYRFDRETHSFVFYAIEGVSAYVRKMRADHLGRVFVITQEAVLQINKETNTLEKKTPLKNKTFRDLVVDERGSIYVVYKESIDRYDSNFNFDKSFEFPFSVTSIIYFKTNQFFINSNSGLKVIDIETMKSVPLQQNLRRLNDLEITGMSNFGDESIIFISKDKHYCYNPTSDKLLSETNSNFPYNKPHMSPDIAYLLKGKRTIWAVTKNGEAFAMERNEKKPFDTLLRLYGSGTFSEIVFDGHYSYFIYNNATLVKYSSESSRIITYPLEDLIGQNEVEISYSLVGNSSAKKLFVINDNIIFELLIQPEDKISFSRKYEVSEASRVYSTTIDKQNRIWASRASESNLYYSSDSVDTDNSDLIQFPIHIDRPRIYITRLLTLRNGTIAAAFNDIGLGIINPDTKDIQYIKLSEKYNRMYIRTMCEDRSGNIWAGSSTFGLFIYNPSTGTVTVPPQFENRNISAIALSDTGEMLISSQYTLYKYDSATNTFSPVWKLPHHINDQNIAIYPTDNGSCLLYSGYQLFYYDPSSSDNIPSSFSAILSDNTSTVLSVANSSSNTPKVVLSKDQTNLTLSIGAPTLKDVITNCKYRVSGHSDGWQILSRDLHIHLNNLSYGKHKVELQLSDITGNSLSDILSFIIFIKRPWYSSLLASTLYLFLLIFASIVILKQYQDRQKKSMEARILRKEKQLLEKLNEENSDFFANMSHEFRTPLTIISGAAKSLENEKDNPESRVKLERIIQRNSDRMLKLVSQMLDFNKLEHNKLSFTVAKTDISTSINNIVEQLSVSAQEKNISIETVGTDKPLQSWVDLDKFEKIMYNLLSNAVKFTPVNGAITVRSKVIDNEQAAELFKNVNASAFAKSDYLEVSVSDTGIGIPKEYLEKVFERFVQSYPSQKNLGTGIGLYFAKMMVELHHGFIKAESENGSTFTFIIPKDEEAYSEAEKNVKIDNTSTIDSSSHLSEYISKERKDKPSTEVKVMIIDDDTEIISLLKSILSPTYEVLACFDAMSGYKQIEQFNPDIIISDIMMVEMDGLQFCKMVKENVDICHIPIILLTAKDTVADQIAGLNCGAEAYIVKPFDPGFLMATIKSLLLNREKLHQIMGKSTKVEKKVEGTISHRDKILLEKLYSLLEKSMSNPEMNIVYFAEELGVSRTKLFYKVKALTGMTPSDFFTQYKLNRSIEYIKEDKYKIAAIAEMCGFNSPSHFSSLFKKQFGVLPREYLNSISEK